MNPSSQTVVLVLGASGPTGRQLLPLLTGGSGRVMAVSRKPPESAESGTMWFQHDLAEGPLDCQASTLISAGPLRHAAEQAEAMTGLGRVVALSSASLLFKSKSPDRQEQGLIDELADAEKRLAAHCEKRQIPLTLFRPAMIYGPGDANVERLADLMRRLPFVPVGGRGRRHPVHAGDLAEIMLRAVSTGIEGTFALGGGETLDYVSMLERIARARKFHGRVVRLPAWLMVGVLRMAHPAGRLKDIRPEMIRRQSRDLLVDDQPARELLGWAPGNFRP